MCNVGATKCCTMNCCQYFPREKNLLLRYEFWNLSFEDCRAYGLNIPRRLHMKGVRIRRKFITIQGLDICETAWY